MNQQIDIRAFDDMVITGADRILNQWNEYRAVIMELIGKEEVMNLERRMKRSYERRDIQHLHALNHVMRAITLYAHWQMKRAEREARGGEIQVADERTQRRLEKNRKKRGNR